MVEDFRLLFGEDCNGVVTILPIGILYASPFQLFVMVSICSAKCYPGGAISPNICIKPDPVTNRNRKYTFQTILV